MINILIDLTLAAASIAAVYALFGRGTLPENLKNIDDAHSW